MSNVGGSNGVTRKGWAPRPHLALPLWISLSIRKGRFDYDQPTKEEIEEMKKVIPIETKGDEHP